MSKINKIVCDRCDTTVMLYDKKEEDRVKNTWLHRSIDDSEFTTKKYDLCPSCKSSYKEKEEIAFIKYVAQV